jgi:FkbH-like protein
MTTAAPDSELLRLLRAGELAARYPEVRDLVRDLTGDELTRAGRLLARIDAAEVLREHPQTPSLRVAVTGHGLLAPLVPALTAEFARHGLLLRPQLSDFDGYIADLGDAGSVLYAADPDLTLCVLDPAIITDDLPTPWNAADAEKVLTERVGMVEALTARFAATARGTLVLNTIPLPRSAAVQLLDHRSRARLGVAWREANARLLRLVESHPSVLVTDLDPLVAEGVPLTDQRLDVYAGAHLSVPLLTEYAREIGHLARQLAGQARKVLVLDLDETLWGGILGDDGVEGIDVGGSGRGAAFAGFQRVVKQIGAQGVLLAVASKNDPEPVRQAFAEHSGMVLGADDFVRISANWQPKPDSIAALADGLGLGVDSMVFADDSAFECGLVDRELPGVAVVRLGEDPAEHAGRLLRDGWFNVRELTGEDHARLEKYRQELNRQDFLGTFTSIEDYRQELGVVVRLGPVTAAEVPRVAQLTVRTNQFNLTTVRLQPADVHALRSAPDARPLAVHAADRFGDNGLVGALFLRRDGDTVHIDNFVLSCRVFARGIEQACLSAVLRHARDSGAGRVLGRYLPTAKNHKVADLYSRCGFAGPDEDGTFRHDLADITPPPGHITLTETFGGSDT